MKRATIDTLKALASTVRSMGTVESHRLDAAIEDLEQELAALEPEVWIPAAGVIVLGGNDLPYISSGRSDLDGCLLVEGPQGDERLHNWRPIPNLTQWTDHDGSDVCPCDGPVHFKFNDGSFLSRSTGTSIRSWALVSAWAHWDKE